MSPRDFARGEPRGLAPSAVRGLESGVPLRGELRPPGSKSLAIRHLVAAGLASGTTRVAGLSDAADVRAALELVAGAGARVESLAPVADGVAVRAVAVTGRPPAPLATVASEATGASGGWSAGAPDGRVALGESGLLARLATAAYGLCGQPRSRALLAGSGSLERRASPSLFRCLALAGVELEFLGRRDSWPVRVAAIGPPSALALDAPGSSQEPSALLLALAAYPDEIELCVRGTVPSRPYLAMTERVLAQYGARVASSADAGGERTLVRGPLRASADPIAIEPDASAAAVLVAAGCLSGGDVLALGLVPDSLQGDVRVAEHLVAFGCEVTWEPRGLRGRGRPTRGAALDLSGEPDLAPVLAAVAAAAALGAGATSELRGLGTLAGKESDRLAGIGGALDALGFAVERGRESLRIGPPRARPRTPVVVETAADHRMVFFAALLGLAIDGVAAREPEAVQKSWPSFWDDLARLSRRPT